MPSIDVLFDSVAQYAGNKSVGVIMTGMGRDGADGLMKIKSKGGYTIAQNEETSVVFGMNRAAIEIGAVNEIVPLTQITDRIVKHI
jgi:two-component system chemotaxis response regulator CheB